VEFASVANSADDMDVGVIPREIDVYKREQGSFIALTGTISDLRIVEDERSPNQKNDTC
jgi:hypothetical protein